MDFGGVEDGAHVDHTLPPDPAITTATLRRLGAGPARLRYGLPIWNRPNWVGPLYPLDSPAGNYLPNYGRLFDTVEVNSSFYHPTSPEQAASWAAAVPAHFRFCVKVWRQLSHDPAPRADDVARFLDGARAFGDRLGLCFLQLPPHADLGWRRPLARLLDLLAPAVPLALELRHPAWFTVEPTRTRLLEHLAERGVAMVITDTSGRRDLVHMSVTAPLTFIRFRGDGEPARDAARISAWSARIGAWTARGLREVYFVGHEPNDREIEALPLLRQLARGLEGRAELTVPPAPEPPQLALL